MDYFGGKKKRSASKASRKSSKSKSRSRSRSKSSRGKVERVKKTYTLVSAGGKDKGGEFVGTSPSAAARKAAKTNLPKKGSGSATVYIRQMTQGKGHNKVFCYNATQRMIDAPEHMRKLGVKGKIREIIVKKKGCPKNVEEM